MLVLAPGASAWGWPVDGPVLRPYVTGDDPYSGGQHRGIDIGAPTGSDVRSAATGIASFVGRVPHQGLCLTVRTADGYSVTLVHLGSIGVTTGTAVSEGDVVGTIGPSGDVEGTEPYVYLGIRLTADPNGYLDPLTLLPPRPEAEPPPVSQSQAPAVQPAPAASRAQVPLTLSVRAKSAPPTRAVNRPASRAHAKSTAPVRSSERPTRRDPTTVARSAPAPTKRVPARPRSWRPRPLGRPASSRALRHVPPTEVGGSPTSETAPARGEVAPAAARDGSRRFLLLALALAGSALVAIGIARGRRTRASELRPIPPRPLRKMSTIEPAPEESLPEPPTTAHSRRRRLALREWPAASRTCRRLRGSVRHHRSVSPPARRPRPDGQRNRRARDAGHGRRRSRRAVSA